jgi:FG-GAP-like repeat
LLADLDRDGKLDVLVAHAPNSTNAGDPDIDRGSVSVYPGRGDGTLDSPATYATGQFPFDLVVADLDGDGWLDVAAAAFIDRAVAILRNDGHGGLLPRVLTPMGNGPVSLAAGDLDADGSLDLVVNRSYEDVYPAAGAEGLAVHDLTGELRPDVVTISSLSSGAFLTLVNRCYADPWCAPGAASA